VVLACVAGLLTGCLNLKPRVDPTRHFVLATLPPPAADAVHGPNPGLVVGLGPVELPGYLRSSSLAVRSSANEVRYDELSRWAERLEEGIPRVLAANLESLLAASQVRTPAWRRSDVDSELRVSIQRFDVDEAGQGQLVARWRITSPGAERMLGHGQAGLSLSGPPPGADPSGAVATLSQLLGEFGRQLAKELATVPRPAGE